MRTVHLDRSKPYGTIHPVFEGAFYEQNGFHFDNDGRLVEALLTKEQLEELSRPVKAPKPVTAKAAAPAPVLTAEQIKLLEEAGQLTPEQKAALAGTAEGEGGDETKDEDVNLELWLKGQAQYEFFKLTAAVFQRFHKKVTRKDDLVQFLVSDKDGPKVVKPDELDPSLRKFIDEGAGA